MADRTPRLHSPDRMQAAIAAAETVARALDVVAGADALTVESLDAALMAIAEATATTCTVPTARIEAHHRPVVENDESASAATRSMQATAVGGQSLQPLLQGIDCVNGSSGPLTRLRPPPSSPRSPADTGKVAAENADGMIAAMSAPAVLPTAESLTAMHRAVATLEQLIHTLNAARPVCTGSQVSQVQGCLSSPQDLQQQIYLLHGCKQELQHAIQRSKVLGTISDADRASARQVCSSTTSVLSWPRPCTTATGDDPEPQLDVLQQYRSRMSNSGSNSEPLSAPKHVHSRESSRGHHAVGFGSLMGQQAAAASRSVPLPAQNRIIQVASGVREVVNRSSGNPICATAQQPSLQVVEHETSTSLSGWLAGPRH